MSGKVYDSITVENKALGSKKTLKGVRTIELKILFLRLSIGQLFVTHLNLLSTYLLKTILAPFPLTITSLALICI